MSVTRNVFLTFLVTVFAVSQLDAQAGQAGTISGTVADSTTLQPLELASVTIEGNGPVREGQADSHRSTVMTGGDLAAGPRRGAW